MCILLEKINGKEKEERGEEEEEVKRETERDEG